MIASTSASCLRRTRTPTVTRSARWPDAARADRARQGRGRLHGAHEFPLPYEYRFIQLEGLTTEPPADLDERTLVFLDCGNIDRTSAEALKREPTALILNVDHHHDNTRFGTINHVDPHASCTAEMVWDLMHGLACDHASRSPRRSTSAWSPTPAASCTRTPGRARTRWPPS